MITARLPFCEDAPCPALPCLHCEMHVCVCVAGRAGQALDLSMDLDHLPASGCDEFLRWPFVHTFGPGPVESNK